MIVDSPAGIGPGFETAAAGAPQAFVVSTPDMVCARDAGIIGRLLEERQLPARLIINRLRPSLVMAGKMPDVDEIIDMAGVPLIGILPEDEEVAVAAPRPSGCRGSVTPPSVSGTSPSGIWGKTSAWHGWKKCDPLENTILKELTV